MAVLFWLSHGKRIGDVRREAKKKDQSFNQQKIAESAKA